MWHARWIVVLAAALGLTGATLRSQPGKPAGSFEWNTYGGNLASSRYAPFDQVNQDTFSRLQIAWRLNTNIFRAAAQLFLVVLVLFVFLRACAEGASSRRAVVLAAKRPVKRSAPCSFRDVVIDSRTVPKSQTSSDLNRRAFLSAAALPLLAPRDSAQSQRFPIGPEPIRYPSTVWKVLDERFRKYMIGNTPLVREWTGALWAEGPAWNGVGRYVVFSDIPNNVQLRWDEATGQVTPFRTPSNFSNGNTFDWQGRQISCEHQTARVVRYDYQGEPTVLASTFDGKRLNAPNDVIVHPNTGGILFTDPGYGSHWYYEGTVRQLELPTSVYHIDAQSGRLTKLTDEIKKPNGLCFSPDYRTLYVADTAPTHFPGEKAKIIAWTVQDNGSRLTSRREFATLDAGFHDGIRADLDGNIWCGTGFGGEGVDGVHVYAPDGTRLGQILMPEGTANLCFVGRNRNRLFMTSSQSVYTLYTAAQGAHRT